MRKYKQKFLWRKILYSNFVIILLIFLIGFTFNGILKVYSKYKLTKADYNYIAKEESEAEEKLRINELKLENINREEGKENYIRETYSVKKPGEGVVIVYDNPAATYEIPKGETSWERFKLYIKNLFSRR